MHVKAHVNYFDRSSRWISGFIYGRYKEGGGREREEEKCSHEQRILLTAFAYRTVKYRAAHGIYCFAWPSWHGFAASFATPLLLSQMKIHSLEISLPVPFLSLFLFFFLFFFLFVLLRWNRRRRELTHFHYPRPMIPSESRAREVEEKG